jgi:hypothetical protein
LVSGVEECVQHEAGESAGQTTDGHFGGDHRGPPGTFVRVGQMPLAPGTGGHQKCGEAGRHDNTAEFSCD